MMGFLKHLWKLLLETLFMAPVAIRSIKEEIKAACHGGRVLGMGFSLVVVLVVQPLAWVRKMLQCQEQ